MAITCCCWCLHRIEVPGNFDQKNDAGVCSQGCRDAEYIFNIHWSDEAINRRAHYRELTEGTDNDEA